MRLISLFEEAWLAIRTNRSRTALTILGIVIGGIVVSMYLPMFALISKIA